jgi:hypothetical protein
MILPFLLVGQTCDDGGIVFADVDCSALCVQYYPLTLCCIPKEICNYQPLRVRLPNTILKLPAFRAGLEK